jgi:hypothetical protein
MDVFVSKLPVFEMQSGLKRLASSQAPNGISRAAGAVLATARSGHCQKPGRSQ